MKIKSVTEDGVVWAKYHKLSRHLQISADVKIKLFDLFCTVAVLRCNIAIYHYSTVQVKYRRCFIGLLGGFVIYIKLDLASCIIPAIGIQVCIRNLRKCFIETDQLLPAPLLTFESVRHKSLTSADIPSMFFLG